MGADENTLELRFGDIFLGRIHQVLKDLELHALEHLSLKASFCGIRTSRSEAETGSLSDEFVEA